MAEYKLSASLHGHEDDVGPPALGEASKRGQQEW